VIEGVNEEREEWKKEKERLEGDMADFKKEQEVFKK
jgi:hypothetical protein